MNIFQKSRFAIYNNNQHPYRHTLSDFAYTNPALPNVTNLEATINWLTAVIYPNTKDPVATPADLPTGTDTPNIGDETPTLLDYRVVSDDGDGKAASYRWEQREGDVAPLWYKIYDMDWGETSILSNFLLQTQDVYVYKYGIGDRDENGDLYTGILAGQRIYGGDLANTNLTLFGNSGDGVSPSTGYVQFGDNIRPINNNLLDLGTATEKIKTGYFGTSILVGNLTLSDGSIISSSGDISFDNENLLTTGSITGNKVQTETVIDLREITTPSAPAVGYDSLYFKSDGKLYRQNSSAVEKLVGLEFTSNNDNRLVRTDGTSGSAIQESGILVSDLDAVSGVTSLLVDNLLLDGNSISSNDANGNINLSPNGTGKVVLNNARISNLTSDRLIRADGNKDLLSSGITLNAGDELLNVARLTVGNLQMTINTLSSTSGNLLLSSAGSINFTGNLLPSADNSYVLGNSSNRVSNIFVSNSFNDGTNAFLIPDFMRLRSANFRDFARTLPAQAGDALFYDSVNGVWLASAPDSEISHSNLSDLSNDDHLQYLLLAGRSGGQDVIGGVDASDNLTLDSTSNATKGSIFIKSNLSPFTDANFSTVWQGTDLGDNTHYLRHLYMKGEAFGFRAENVTTATIPSSSANNVGRFIFNTDTNKLLVDVGTQFRVAGVSKHVEDLVFNGTDLTKDVDVSANIGDARNAVIQLKSNSNDYEVIYATLKATTATNVRVETTIPLAAGSYRLIVIE